MTIPDLTPSKKDPTWLDQAAIVTDHGMLVGRFGFAMELFVAPRDRRCMRDDLFKVQQDYFHTFRPWITDYRSVSEAKPDGWVAKISDDPFPMIQSSVGAWPEHRAYNNVIFGDSRFPRHPDKTEITNWLSYFVVSPERAQDKELSYYSCYMPISDDLGGSRAEQLKDKLLHWCEAVKPAHGLAGYSVVLEMGSTTGERYAYPVAQRYPGLDIGEAGVFCARAKPTHNRIKSVNWLTVLGDAIFDELGGLAKAREALGPDCTVHQYTGGIVIQAGASPQLGDTYHGEIPEAYRKVAQFTKPVRFQAYRSSLFRVFEPMDGKEEAARWVGRFD